MKRKFQSLLALTLVLLLVLTGCAGQAASSAASSVASTPASEAADSQAPESSEAAASGRYCGNCGYGLDVRSPFPHRKIWSWIYPTGSTALMLLYTGSR